MEESDVQRMFDDMVNRFFSTRDPSPLHCKVRVATMCSGTESPLLALKKMGDALRRSHDVVLEVDHVFSCEIEPFKQAYIERNFAPKLLFRDIRELGGERAATAYGSLRDVPGDVDMLVAGTSCVDYSNLNNDKKSIDDKGESGQTFRGMMSWVKKHMPPIVLLENVCNAPWDVVAKRFEDVGYASHFTRFDTKKYYIPHTRTRVYLLAILTDKKDAIGEWKRCVKSLESPAKGSIESFLFSADDPRLEATRLACSQSKKRSRTCADWGRCESRHKKFRMEENLGNGVPLTSWHTGCQLPEHSWNDWGKAQPERVLDLLDIFYLRYASKGTDAAYKSMAWNLSQNVDRSGGDGILGVAPCLTPSMIPFATVRGGPIIGLESLSLQGIPVEDLIMTRETENQMKDLSGNAMSTTVVGACMLAALWLHGGLPLPPEEKREKAKKLPAGVQYLRDVPLSRSEISTRDLLLMAHDTRRACASEMGDAHSKFVQKCEDCGATVSEHFSGNPKHGRLIRAPRRKHEASAFREALLKALPMKFLLAGDLVEDPNFVFQKLCRGEQWRVVYKSDRATMELRFVDASEAVWLLFGEDEIKPAARLRVFADAKHLWEGLWQRRETPAPVRLTIQGEGELTNSWQSTLGLPAEGKVWSSYRVSGHESVDGVYDALPKCGKAMNSLHKRRGGDLFLFLDPDYYGSEESDRFVFSKYHHRVVVDEKRELVGRLDSSFRQNDEKDRTEYFCEIEDEYVDARGTLLSPMEYIRSVSLTENISQVSKTASVCGHGGVALMKIVAPLTPAEKKRWSHAASDREKMRRFTWLNSLITFPETYATFTDIVLRKTHCEDCAPTRPAMRWVRKAGQKKLSCQEDPEAAGDFEKAMKCRPEIFNLFWSVSSEYDLGELIISVDPVALAHRAVGMKEGTLRQNGFAPLEPLGTQWRIARTVDGEPECEGFHLLSNKEDQVHDEDLPGWNADVPLRLEQRRSLAWMLQQETRGVPFEEEEVSEKVFPLLNIRAEGRAFRKRIVRGGVLADQVGFGKTALAVAVVAGNKGLPAVESQYAHPTAATLVLVPSQLMKQWPEEINKFCPTLRVVVVKTVADLNNLTVRTVEQADVVVVNTTVLRSPTYFARLSQIAGVRELKQDSPRHFAAAYEEAVRALEGVLGDVKEGSLRDFRVAADENVSVVSNRMKGAKLLKSTERAGGEGMTFVEALDKEDDKKQTQPFDFFPAADDFQSMRSPPLEMFHWKRIVIDEFTYLQDFDYCVSKAIVAENKWCLSGTPPLSDFNDVKTSAALLGVNLGVDDLSHLSKRDVTKVESFHFYREERSESWKRRRNFLAQKYLNKFARQNIAEIDEIKLQDTVERISLSAEEKTLYLELEHHIKALDAKVAIKKGGGDKGARLALALEGCDTPIEALVKRCSYYEKNVSEILSMRKKQYEECEKDLRDKITETAALVRTITSRCGEWPARYENFYERWKKRAGELGSGDPDVTEGLKALIRESERVTSDKNQLPSIGAVIDVQGMEAVVTAYSGTWKQKAHLAYEDGLREEVDMKTLDWELVETAAGAMEDEELSNKTWEAREKTHEIEKLLKELVSRKRSLRFFKNLVLPPDYEGESTYVLSGCGHVGTKKELTGAADNGTCHHLRCLAPAKHGSVLERIPASTKDLPPNGSKLSRVVDMIRQTPPEDKVIVFVQFSDLSARVESALTEAGVRAVRLAGSVHQQTKALESFQKDAGIKALLMLCRSESAAGANLTVANHAFFVHPLITESAQEYEASETQAVGRMRRYGQKKKVFVWRFVADRTVEGELLKNKGVAKIV